MAEPLNDTDVHGLSTTARVWTPRGMKASQDGRDFLDALADCVADALNPLIDMEGYLPLILNPNRCLDGDVDRILALNGIDRRRSYTNPQARRLAILGSSMREWRGAFRVHRAVTGALTGGQVVIRTYIIQRFILDESSFDLILLTDDDADTTQIFLLGQGPDGTNYNEGQLDSALSSLAKVVLDDIELVPCWALTAWRDGLAGWVSTGSPSLVQSSVNDEFEGVDLGPDIDATASQFIGSPTRMPNPDGIATEWSTVWFKTGDAAAGDYWEHHMHATERDGSDDAYVVRIPVRGVGSIEVRRLIGGSYAAPFGSYAKYISDGLDGTYHRLDMVVAKSASKTSIRIYIDNDPGPWFHDSTISPRPEGEYTSIGLKTTSFTSGRLRIAAITAREQ